MSAQRTRARRRRSDTRSRGSHTPLAQTAHRKPRAATEHTARGVKRSTTRRTTDLSSVLDLTRSSSVCTSKSRARNARSRSFSCSAAMEARHRRREHDVTPCSTPHTWIPRHLTARLDARCDDTRRHEAGCARHPLPSAHLVGCDRSATAPAPPCSLCSYAGHAHDPSPPRPPSAWIATATTTAISADTTSSKDTPSVATAAPTTARAMTFTDLGQLVF